jgi:hypothetical protein
METSIRKPLATESELKVMDSGAKYWRYLYDLETVHQFEIKELEKVTGGEWSVWQTGGMCCVLGWSVEASDGRYLIVCPEGNLNIDRSDDPGCWYLGWDQEDETGSFALVSGESDLFGSFAEVVDRLKKYMKGVK